VVGLNGRLARLEQVATNANEAAEAEADRLLGELLQNLTDAELDEARAALDKDADRGRDLLMAMFERHGLVS
jgi:hypothetical protein